MHSFKRGGFYIPKHRAPRSTLDKPSLGGGGYEKVRSAQVQGLALTSASYLTCSLTSLVVPASSSHRARKTSPRNAFKGFLTPSSGDRPAYCWFRSAEMNHLRTRRARSAGSSDPAGATNTDGLSAQKAGNSTVDFVSSTKGGAVIFERSPRMTEIDCLKTWRSTWEDCVVFTLPRVQAKASTLSDLQQ